MNNPTVLNTYNTAFKYNDVTDNMHESILSNDIDNDYDQPNELDNVNMLINNTTS